MQYLYSQDDDYVFMDNETYDQIQINQENIEDKIRLITKNKIFSEIIQNETKKEYYLQYHLDSKSKTISRQRYIKKHDDDILKPDGAAKKSYCADVKANWKNIKEE